MSQGQKHQRVKDSYIAPVTAQVYAGGYVETAGPMSDRFIGWRKEGIELSSQSVSLHLGFIAGGQELVRISGVGDRVLHLEDYIHTGWLRELGELQSLTTSGWNIC